MYVLASLESSNLSAHNTQQLYWGYNWGYIGVMEIKWKLLFRVDMGVKCLGFGGGSGGCTN